MTTPRRPFRIDSTSLQYDEDGVVINTYSHHSSKWTPDEDVQLFGSILSHEESWRDSPKAAIRWSEVKEDVPGKTAVNCQNRINALINAKMLPSSVAMSIERVKTSGGDLAVAKQIGLNCSIAVRVIREIDGNPDFKCLTTLADVKQMVVNADMEGASSGVQTKWIRDSCKSQLFCVGCDTQQVAPPISTLQSSYNHGATYKCSRCCSIAARVIREMDENPGFKCLTTLADVKQMVVDADMAGASSGVQTKWIKRRCGRY